MRGLRTMVVAACVAAMAGACVPAMDGDLAPRPAQAINVINELSHPMVVWFDDGTGERLLGTVAGESTERFILTDAAPPTVTVVARDEGRTQTVRRTVTLRADVAVDVRLQ